jgi:DnaJ-class molecular chaperone
MWMTCPNCEGIGKERFSRERTICAVCLGEKIIHQKTGLPPVRHNNGLVNALQLSGFHKKRKEEP